MSAAADIRVHDGRHGWSDAALERDVAATADRLRQRGVRTLATLLDNGAAWVVADLAAARAAVVHVPLPLFFTPAQRAHVLESAGVDALLRPAAPGDSPALAFELAGSPLALQRLPHAPVALPRGTVKITYTSGTTGAPKGICLSGEAMARVADGLAAATAALGIEHHLCVLPLAVLLENVAGVLAPLRRGARCSVLPLREVGLTGSSQFDPARLHDAVTALRPQSLILLPQMLRAWTGWLRATGRRAPPGLQLVAVGGAAVGAPLLEAARAAGLPAFEGYGLSEAASVQTLNLPGADRPGSAGRALPHARLRVAPDGEILVAGSLMLGTLGSDAAVPDWWPTGDLGEIDADGYLHLRGRRKHVLITAFGRNVSPEWVETALRCHDAIAHAVVFGDGAPALSAVLWPLHADVPDAALQAAVDAANAGLPDYARVHRWARARAPFDAASGLATPNGRPRREAIRQRHADALDPAPEPSLQS